MVAAGAAAGLAAPFVAAGMGVGRARAAEPDERALCLPAPQGPDPTPQVAVSLRRLSAMLDLRARGGTDGKPLFRARAAALRRLRGMTRLDGFVVDPAGRDLVLWGKRVPGEPALELDDFVIALRAALGRYTIERDGRRIRVSPGISLDADGAVFRSLRKVEVATPEGRRRYREMCSAPMIVRVDGMPRHTRVAKVLVDADFRMKLVGMGDVRLPIRDPFPSDFEARARAARYVRSAGLSTRPVYAPGRMWFEPARFTYQTSPGGETLFLDRAQVRLSERTQRVTAAGELVDGGPSDAFAVNFACAWTDRMDDVAASEPIWADMIHIFRTFAIAELAVRTDALRRARFDADYLVERHRPAHVPLPDTMPGYAKFLDLKGAGGSLHTVCGGVSVHLHDRLGPSERSSRALGPAARRAIALAQAA